MLNKEIIVKLLNRNTFIKHVTILSGATVFAQLINILIMPIVSRLYSPADFGILAVFSSVIILLVTISGFRYYLVIPVIRRERYVHAIICLSFIIQIIFAIFCALLIELFKAQIAATSFKDLLPYRILIPIGIFALGIYSLLSQWAIREKEFPLIAQTKFVQSIAQSVTFILGGVMRFAPLGLLIGFIAGQSLGGFSLFRSIKAKTSKIDCNVTRIKRVAIVYRRLFLYDTPSSFINMSGMYLLPAIMAYFWTPDVVGSFSMANRILWLPSSLIGTAIGQVFVQRCGTAKYDGGVGKLYIKTLNILFILGVGPILVIGITAPFIFPLVLGSKWFEAGQFAMLISPWVALNFVYSPLSMTYTILMLQRTGFVFTSLYTIARISPLCILSNNPSDALTLLSSLGTIFMIIGLTLPGFFIKDIKTSFLFRSVITLTIKILLSLSPMYLAFCIFRTDLLFLILSTVLSMFLYILMGYKTMFCLNN